MEIAVIIISLVLYTLLTQRKLLMKLLSMFRGEIESTTNETKVEKPLPKAEKVIRPVAIKNQEGVRTTVSDSNIKTNEQPSESLKDFDLKKAIIYKEILEPKYKEY